jgi:hypothetical protein
MDKRTLAATGLLVWAGALQAHMWYTTSSDAYKTSPIAKAGDSTDWSFSFGSSSTASKEDK